MLWYEKAQFYLNQGEFKAAIQFCQQALKQQPHQPLAYQLLGKIFQQQQNHEAALQCYSQALVFDPDNSQIYLEIGNIYKQQQRWQDAIISYQAAIRLQPQFIEAYRNLGQILIQLKRWQAAVKVYQTLIELNPQVSWFYNHLGKAWMQLHCWQDAINAYQTAVQLNPTFSWSYYHLAQCWMQLEQWHQAMDAYQTAIQLQPSHLYYHALGKLFQQQGQLDQAIEALLQALHFQPNCYEIFALLGNILKQQGFEFEGLECQCLIKIPNFLIQRYFDLPHAYQTQTDLDQKIQRHIIYPATFIQLHSPKALPGDIPSEFQTKQIQLSEVFTATLNHSRVWSDSLTHAVITSDNQIITDLSEGCPELILSSRNLPQPLVLEGKVAVLSVQFGLVYHHWMLDLIPQLHLIQQQGLSWDEIDYFVVNRHQTDYETTTLNILGIPEDKIIETVQFPFIQATEMIACSHRRQSMPPQQWVINYLKTCFLEQTNLPLSSSRFIYIARTQAKRRKIINEAAVIHQLQQNGFQVVNFESMSILEQAQIMANAEVVIAPHGSGLTNLIFCQPQTKVIEILSPNWLNSCYWMLSQICGLDYYCFMAESATSSNFNQYQDLFVNIQQLRELIALAEGVETGT